MLVVDYKQGVCVCLWREL